MIFGIMCHPTSVKFPLLLPRLSDEKLFEYEVPLVSAFKIHKEVEWGWKKEVFDREE